MSISKFRPEPEWVARFLAALREGRSVRAAVEAARVANGTVYHRRAQHPAFKEAWDACQPVDGRSDPQPAREPRRTSSKIDRFLDALAATYNVTAAAEAASLSTSAIYRQRREDPAFARRWYAALAEGYDNLEMELLGRLRAGESSESSSGAASAKAPKFDTATALLCLTAHRESVAREKGRRTLAAEVTTIASINAKIDALCERQAVNRRKITAERRKLALESKVAQSQVIASLAIATPASPSPTKATLAIASRTNASGTDV